MKRRFMFIRYSTKRKLVFALVIFSILSLGLLSFYITTKLVASDNTFSDELDKDGNIISGNSVKISSGSALRNTDPKTGKSADASECFATICLNKNMAEIYCPRSYAQCCEKYSGCRKIDCDDPSCEDNATTDVYSSSPSECTAEYNDCYDGSTAVTCKGSFEQCSASFDSCSCGSEDSSVSEVSDSATPEIDTSEDVPCDTGIFICKKQVITMSGEIGESKVTCKGSFAQCSMQHGACACGNATLTAFPTKYIGDATIGSAGGENAENYWCEYDSKKVPCYMLPGNCTKKKNTCNRGDGIYVTCEGYFDFCNDKFSGKCLCGVEVSTSGFMYGST